MPSSFVTITTGAGAAAAAVEAMEARAVYGRGQRSFRFRSAAGVLVVGYLVAPVFLFYYWGMFFFRGTYIGEC